MTLYYNNPIKINYDSIVNSTILGYYVKYDRLKQLIDFTFAGSNATEVDIYIDIKNILYQIDKNINRSGIIINNPLTITSSIINMIAHYRHFFATRYNCTSRFFLIDSISELLSYQYCSEYSVPKLSNNIIKLYDKTNLEFLVMITQYINDVQFVSTCTNIITKALSIHDIETKKNPSIIISKDPYTLQASIHPDFYVLVPKKNKTNGDISVLSNSQFAINIYLWSTTRKNTNTPIDQININLLPMLMAMTRVPSKSLHNIMNIPSSIQRLQNISVTPNISYYPSDINQFLEILLQDSQHLKHLSRIYYRYQACDATNTLYNGYKLHPECITYTGIVNLYDPDSIKAINNEHFKDCPLDLNAL